MVVFRMFSLSRAIIISALIFLILAPTTYASQLDDKRAKLKDINAQIQATEAKQGDTAQRQENILQQIRVSNQKIVLVQIQLNSLQMQLNDMIVKRQAADVKLHELQKRLSSTSAELADAQKRLALKRKVFNKRLVIAYKNKNLSIITVLLQSGSFSDLLDRVAFIGMIAEADGRVVLNTKRLTATVASKLAQVKTTKEAVSREHAYLVAEEQHIKEKKGGIITAQKQLQDEVGKQQRLYAQIQKEKDRLARTIGVLKDNSSVVAGQIAALENRGNGTAKAASIPTDLKSLAAKIAGKYGIPPKLFFALINQESGWNYRSVSSAGAVGLTQIMPFNITAMGYNIETFKNSPSDQLEAGAKYLSMQYKTFGRWDLALAAYNAGPGAVLMYGGIPPYSETKNYVRSILSMANR